MDLRLLKGKILREVRARVMSSGSVFKFMFYTYIYRDSICSLDDLLQFQL